MSRILNSILMFSCSYRAQKSSKSIYRHAFPPLQDSARSKLRWSHEVYTFMNKYQIFNKFKQATSVCLFVRPPICVMPVINIFPGFKLDKNIYSSCGGLAGLGGLIVIEKWPKSGKANAITLQYKWENLYALFRFHSLFKNLEYTPRACILLVKLLLKSALRRAYKILLLVLNSSLINKNIVNF